MAQTPTTSPLTVARRHRAQLLVAIQEMESAAAGPAAEAGWRDRVSQRAGDLARAFAEHVHLTEGPDGLYAELLEGSPRLTRQVRGLAVEHGAIMRLLEEMTRRISGSTVAAIRTCGNDLIHALSRHRQRGADLVYEAYATDIGGET
jgi:hypothetical protein